MSNEVRGLILSRRDMERPAAWQGPLDAVYFAARMPGKTSENEDAVGLWDLGDGRSVLAVADGIGGAPAGDRAALAAMEALDGVLRESPEDLRGALLAGFDHGNQAVQALGVGAGTTLIAAAIEGDTLRVVHAGDSEARVVGQRGRQRLETLAHSPVGYAVRAGLMSDDEGLRSDVRHILSNCLGSPEMHVSLSPSIRLARRDTLIIASDGVFDNVSRSELTELIRCGPLATVGERLLSRVHARMQGEPPVADFGKPDDLGFVVARRSRA